jgi:hypothetical protein
MFLANQKMAAPNKSTKIACDIYGIIEFEFCPTILQKNDLPEFYFILPIMAQALMLILPPH